MEPTPPFRSVVRFLYNHNPFYVLSALFLLYGLKLSFRPGEVAYIDPWALAGAIAGYTAVMAVTGWLVVRWGRIWEDARSIFLVILLMFLAASVSLDELLNLNPDTGRWLLAGALAGVVLLTEALLLSLRIRLPAMYRLPYYAWWALCFLFPLLVSPEVTSLSTLETAWRMAAFPLLAGLIVLSLIPAVRSGPSAVAANGTPWGWPLYPWTLFVFLGLAVCFRSYAMTISFLPFEGMQTAFCTYFLVPFGLCIAVLLLEFALRSRSARFQRGVMAASLGLLLLSLPQTNGDPISASFLLQWTTTLGSPIYLTAISLSGLALYAELRRAKGNDLVMTAALLALTVIGPRTVSAATLLPAVQPFPLVLLAGWWAVRAVQRRRSLEWLPAIACLVVAFSQVPEILVPWPDYQGLAIYHLAMLLTVLLAVLGRDRLSRVLRIVTAIWIPLSGGVALHIARPVLSAHAAWPMYLIGLFLLVAVCWLLTRDQAYLLAGAAMMVGGLFQALWIAFLSLVQAWGLFRVLAIVGSLTSFVIGAGISYLKATVRDPLTSHT